MTILHDAAPITPVAARATAALYLQTGSTLTLEDSLDTTAGPTGDYTLRELRTGTSPGDIETRLLVSTLSMPVTMADRFSSLRVDSSGPLIGSDQFIQAWIVGSMSAPANYFATANGQFDFDIHMPASSNPPGGTPGPIKLIFPSLINTTITWLHKADGSDMPDGRLYWQPALVGDGFLDGIWPPFSDPTLAGTPLPDMLVWDIPGTDNYAAYDLTGLRLSFGSYGLDRGVGTEFGTWPPDGTLGGGLNIHATVGALWTERHFIYVAAPIGAIEPPPWRPDNTLTGQQRSGQLAYKPVHHA